MPRGRRDVDRPIRIRQPDALPRGPRLYSEPKDKGFKGPVSDPPTGFVRATTSISEWMVYWAIAKVMGVPQDPRQPPFIGFPGVWSYQAAVDAGRHSPGGSVIDYVVYAGKLNRYDVAFRLQTEFFHLYTGEDVHAHDWLQYTHLSSYFRVVDLYDEDFLNDPTGQTCIVQIKDALAGRTEPNPITDGTTQRVTRQIFVST